MPTRLTSVCRCARPNLAIKRRPLPTQPPLDQDDGERGSAAAAPAADVGCAAGEVLRAGGGAVSGRAAAEPGARHVPPAAHLRVVPDAASAPGHAHPEDVPGAGHHAVAVASRAAACAAGQQSPRAGRSHTNSAHQLRPGAQMSGRLNPTAHHSQAPGRTQAARRRHAPHPVFDHPEGVGLARAGVLCVLCIGGADRGEPAGRQAAGRQCAIRLRGFARARR
jgi:hypothetical protein